MTDLREFYAALVESSDDAIVAKNTEGIVISWNPAAERLFGWSAAEMVGGSIRKLLPPDRQEEEDEILSRIKAGERVRLFDAKRLHKDGRLLDVSVSVSPVLDARGKVVGASKIARDIGPQLAAQARLRESEERFRLLADNINQFAWIAEPDGRIVWFNKRWEEFTGLTEDDPVDHAGARVVHPDHVERVFANYMKAIEAGEDYDDTFLMRGADGSYRWFLSRAEPVRDESGAIVRWFGTNTDISQQREQSEQIQLLLKEVNHRSKNMLAKVQALARSSIGGDDALVKRFEQRVGSLAVNQDILVRRDWREVPVEELVRLQLGFLDGVRERIAAGGPECALNPRAAEVLGMALHELATNSLKYGALSADGGSVDIAWECAEAFRIGWRERDGPAVAPPARQGFGTTLIVDIPRRSLGAEVALRYDPEGVAWELVARDGMLARQAEPLG